MFLLNEINTHARTVATLFFSFLFLLGRVSFSRQFIIYKLIVTRSYEEAPGHKSILLLLRSRHSKLVHTMQLDVVAI